MFRLDDGGVFRAIETDARIYLWREQIQLQIREVRRDNTNRFAAVVAQSAMVVESPFCVVSYSHFPLMMVLICLVLPMNCAQRLGTKSGSGALNFSPI